jgi:hypothetical protein
MRYQNQRSLVASSSAPPIAGGYARRKKAKCAGWTKSGGDLASTAEDCRESTCAAEGEAKQKW